MQAQNRPVRFKGIASSKHNLLGNWAEQALPAWRNHDVGVPPQAVGQSAIATTNGKRNKTRNKISLSKLPSDVGDKEVEVCFD